MSVAKCIIHGVGTLPNASWGTHHDAVSTVYMQNIVKKSGLDSIPTTKKMRLYTLLKQYIYNNVIFTSPSMGLGLTIDHSISAWGQIPPHVFVHHFYSLLISSENIL